MATLFLVHPDNPQSRQIEQIVAALKHGAVMLYPTDTVWAIGCDLNIKSAIERVRQIKRLSNDKPLTFLCPSLSNIAKYAGVSDAAYRIMKHLVPGPYTFLLPATKLVPRLVMNPKRKSTGIRVPKHPVCQALLDALGNPIISTSAHILDNDDDEAMPQVEKSRLFDQMAGLVDVIVDNGVELGEQTSTILDMTQDEPAIIRRGLGWEEVANWIPVVN